MSESKKIRELLGLLEGYFKDKKKVRMWMDCPNPLLGMVKPKIMVENGRIEKLLKFVKNCLSENESPGGTI
jgi:hypothetical protein